VNASELKLLPAEEVSLNPFARSIQEPDPISTIRLLWNAELAAIGFDSS
jgi:hypothetical protein